MTTVEVPLQPMQQTLTTTLGGQQLHLRVTWNDVASVWLLDIADANSVPLVSGVAVVAGADLLEQFEYLGLGGALVALTDGDANTPPTFDNLGLNGHLYFVSTP